MSYGNGMSHNKVDSNRVACMKTRIVRGSHAMRQISNVNGISQDKVDNRNEAYFCLKNISFKSPAKKSIMKTNELRTVMNC